MSKIDRPIHHRHEEHTADDIADGHRQKIRKPECPPGQSVEVRDRLGDRCSEDGVEYFYRQRVWNEIHIRNAMLETSRHERGDRKDDRGDLIERTAGAKGQPDRQAHQSVTKDAKRHSLQKIEV